MLYTTKLLRIVYTNNSSEFHRHYQNAVYYLKIKDKKYIHNISNYLVFLTEISNLPPLPHLEGNIVSAFVVVPKRELGLMVPRRSTSVVGVKCPHRGKSGQLKRCHISAQKWKAITYNANYESVIHADILCSFESLWVDIRIIIKKPAKQRETIKLIPNLHRQPIISHSKYATTA